MNSNQQQVSSILRYTDHTKTYAEWNRFNPNEITEIKQAQNTFKSTKSRWNKSNQAAISTLLPI